MDGVTLIQQQRPQGMFEGWWDYTTLPKELLNEAAALDVPGMKALARDGFEVNFYPNVQQFYLAEALEYIWAWSQGTAAKPAGICGPIGPTQQLPLVAMLVKQLGLQLDNAVFWGMDQWTEDGKPVAPDHPLSFVQTDRELCFDRIPSGLLMPQDRIIFPTEDLAAFTQSFDDYRCVIMQGGQGWTKHWAFNDPFRRTGNYVDNPPTPEEYLELATRVTDLHPQTRLQNARTSGGGRVQDVPTEAATVGPVETWKAETVSIWQAGVHDDPLGMRLSTMMIGKRIVDTSVPMSLLAMHPGKVRFNFLEPGIGTCNVEMN